MKLRTQNVALTVGFFLGGIHLIWSILIILGLAQPLLTFVFWIHMLNVSYRVTEFTLTQSLTLIFSTFIFGYGCGWVFAWVWNKCHH